jgi:tetratricopeptide (TPR) repeat protein
VDDSRKIMMRFSLIFIVGAIIIYFVMAGKQPPLPTGHPPLDSGMPNEQFEALTGHIDELKSQLADDPDNHDIITQIANTYYDLDQYSDAINYYEKALAIQPKDATVLADCAVMYFKSGDADKALAYIDKAIDLQPDLAQAWFNKGLILMAGKNEPMQAVETWRHYIELAPETEQAKFIKQQIDMVESSMRQSD